MDYVETDFEYIRKKLFQFFNSGKIKYRIFFYKQNMKGFFDKRIFCPITNFSSNVANLLDIHWY